MTLLFFVLGLALLIVGAELLVQGGARLAAAMGIPALVIGLTVVAYGTSAPELIVSLTSSFAGQTDIAVGNVVGSNIFNILFILGLSALIAPLVVSQQMVRLDVPLMIGISVLTLLFGLDGQIGRIDGLILFTSAVIYTIVLFWQSTQAGERKEDTPADTQAEHQSAMAQSNLSLWPVNLLYIAGGLACLILGARWLIDSAVTIARSLGLSELIIGLTIVAAGTSLPEVATSVVASIRGEQDIAVGNLVGSNVFNLATVLGLSGLVAPDGIPVSTAALRVDLPIMLAVAVACLPIFFTGYRIDRWEGGLFLGYYIAYLGYLILNASQHTSMPLFNAAIGWFVLPLTLITLVIVTVRSLRN